MRITILLSLLASLIVLNITGCKSTQKTAEDVPLPPGWLTERPTNPAYYYGIGSAGKSGSLQMYREQATEKALAAIAGQISMHINSNVSMYRVEDRSGVREFLENRIKTESKNFLEGYEMMDDYQDEAHYYVIYSLSKDTYRKKREERRQKAIDAAKSNYVNGKDKTTSGEYGLAVRFLVKALENIEPFAGENLITVFENDTLDVSSATIEQLKFISGQLQLISSVDTVKISGPKFSGKNLTLRVSDHQQRPASDVPLFLTFEGGYLVSNRVKTGKNGICTAPDINLLKNRNNGILTAKIDFYRLVAKHTENIGIRNMVKQWSTQEVFVFIKNETNGTFL